MARACCAALGGFAVPAADRGFVGSAQHEETTAMFTLSLAGFGERSNLNKGCRAADQYVASIRTSFERRAEVCPKRRPFAPPGLLALARDKRVQFSKL